MMMFKKKTKPMVGIWWWTDDNQIIGVAKPKSKGVNSDGMIQYSDKENHSTLWRKVLYDNLPKETANIMYEKGYKSLYHGTVCYNTRTACYEISCSKDIVKDADFRVKVVDAHKLADSRYEFVTSPWELGLSDSYND
ncbi:MAG: hypothetical protein K6B68_03770 [Eubacterium sp.]|nr:hypothetical protein [Eubacterium sp.]